MNTVRDQEPRTARPDRGEASKTETTKKSWNRPEFVEIAACAEICAYVHRA